MENEVVCGSKCLESQKKLDQSTSSLKTALCYALEDLSPSCKTLPKSGTMRNGQLWERTTWVRPISVSACGSWPTPTVCGNYNRKGLSKTSGDGLATAVKKWPTPQAHKTTRSGEIVNVDGTPWDGIRKPHSKTTGRQITTALADAVAHGGDQTQPTTLNPAWVEWLMNWPVGWTSLEPIDHDKFEFWKKSSAAIIQGDTVRAVWFSRDPATPSCGQESAQQSAREHQDSLSGLPQKRPHAGRDMGCRQGRTCCLQGLFFFIPAKKNSSILYLQPCLSKRVGADLCGKTLGEFGRMSNGVKFRADRLKALGNGQVPIVAAAAWQTLVESAL